MEEDVNRAGPACSYADKEGRVMATANKGEGNVPGLTKMAGSKDAIADVRKMLIAKQKGICPICGGDITRTMSKNVVIDHDHDTGIIRAALHKGCNGMEGKVKRLIRTWGKATDMHEVVCTLKRLLSFWELHSSAQYNIIYYGHKTATEKRLAANKKRRKTAAKKREA